MKCPRCRATEISNKYHRGLVCLKCGKLFSATTMR